jgi:hypothetical protein
MARSHADGQRQCPTNNARCQLNFCVVADANPATFPADIAGMVAFLTESDLSSVALAKEELGAVGETAYTTFLC